MPRKSKTDHCVMKNGHPFCMNCGQSYTINLPAPIPVVTGAIDGFIKAHKDCEKTWTEPVVDLSKPFSERVLWWCEHGNRGVSSETILANYIKVKGRIVPVKVKRRPESDWDHPKDPSDFNRCHMLLEALPEIRENLEQMREVSPVWAKLVDNWDKLTEMLEEQLATGKRNGMYEFMKELGC
jgi:hypothetical protein